MNVTDFHKQVIEMELESIMLTLKQYTELFGALNWKEKSALDTLANATGQHPIKTVLTNLAVWLDAYEQGIATGDGWNNAMDAASYVQGIADIHIHEMLNRNNPRWQDAKAAARETIRRESVSEKVTA